MARPVGESTFEAPLARSWSGGRDEGDFERELLGFCVASLLDQRAALGENRTFWAGRLGVSKSHISKMTDQPTPAFIERFVLALTAENAGSPDEADPETVHDRLTPLLSDFYADLRPPERQQPTRAVLKWFARYQPDVTAQLTQVLFQSEVALEKCRMLERAGGADYDDDVRESLRDLLIVASGPYGGAVIALQQIAELGLMVPSAFFEEVEAMLNGSPLGFRLLRTVDRFVRLWQAPGPTLSRPRKQVVDALLPRLLAKLGTAAAAGTFLDLYPGREWGTAVAGECLKVGRKDLTEAASAWLLTTVGDETVAERGRLHAAWVLGCARPTLRDEVTASLQKVGEQTLLARWVPLLDLGWRVYGNPLDPESKDADGERPTVAAFEAAVRAEFADVERRVGRAVTDLINEAQHEGLTRALSSLLFSALVTPDGRLRRALIEGVSNTGLVASSADVLSALIALEPGTGNETFALANDGMRETAIFLLGLLRQPNDPAWLGHLAELATNDPSADVRHAAVWAIGDLSKKNHSAVAVLEPLTAIATGGSPRWTTRAAAAHVLAVIAHEEEHWQQLDVVEAPRAAPHLNAVLSAWHGDASPGAHVVRAISLWGTLFEAQGGFDMRRVRTLSGLLEGSVSEQYDFGDEARAAGDPRRSGADRKRRGETLLSVHSKK